MGVLGDPDLYVFTGGEPPTRSDLEKRYEAQIAGPASAEEEWHNWILRLADSHEAVGYVQCTVTTDAADIAWVVGTDWQGRGLATEAATEMCRWLIGIGSLRLTAHIHPDHTASRLVAARVGLTETGEVDDEGETVWERRA